MDTNGDSRSKRRHSGSTHLVRPNKHVKDEHFDFEGGPTELEAHDFDEHRTTNNNNDDGMDSMTESGLLAALEQSQAEARMIPPAVAGDSLEWQRTIEHVVRNVVSVRFSQTCSFDADPALTSEATGFVVDKEKGYILTNRHVVCAGPFWGYCVFDNHEEVFFQDTEL